MKNILVVYFSQTGQLKNILDSVCSGLNPEKDLNISFAEIKMEKNYPFPWSAVEFFDTFPESVQQIPQPIIQPYIDESISYDLIILGYQTWYMSPCIPINSFLKTGQAERVLKNRPVVTVIGARNMWLVGQEKMKKILIGLNANLVGNIALIDKNPNLIGILTVLGWMLKGKKEKFLGFLPASGVSKNDIAGARIFGTTIRRHMLQNDLENLQLALISQKAVEVNPKLLQLEKRANRLFKLWSKFMLAKGGPGDPKRKLTARLLLFLIPLGALILAPVSALIAIISAILNRKKMRSIKNRFSNLDPVADF